MSELQGNNNYFEALTPTGRDIQGVIPVKKYYVLDQPFNQPVNNVVLSIPIKYRKSISDHSNQYIYLVVKRTGGGLLQPYLLNQTNSDLQYIAIIEQQFNNTVQQKNYLQRDNSYTTVPTGQMASNSFMTLQSFGTSTDNTSMGNDRGSFNLNIEIDNHNINIIGSWYTPLLTNLSGTNNPPYNGLITLETVDNYINLV